MKNRKGFTIVELVIVIAVIAILAAVLIPTFSGVVANANASAALQTARSTLSSALNMSSTGALAGENATGTVKTAFLVDGYAFNYQGNQLEAMNYPGAAGSPLLTGSYQAKANDDDKIYNFNAILIAAQNLKKTIETYKQAETQPNVNNFSQQTYYTIMSGAGTDESPYVFTEAKEFAEATANENGYYVEDSVKYEIDESFSKIIDGASNIHLAENAKTIAVTFKDGRYFLDYAETSGDAFTFTAEVFVNSDFSKKVVVFTTFG